MFDTVATGAFALVGAAMGATLPGLIAWMRSSSADKHTRQAAATLIRDDLYAIQKLIVSDVLDHGYFRFGTQLELRSTIDHLQALAPGKGLDGEGWRTLCGSLRDGRHYAATPRPSRLELQGNGRETAWLLSFFQRLDRARLSLEKIDLIDSGQHEDFPAVEKRLKEEAIRPETDSQLTLDD